VCAVCWVAWQLAEEMLARLHHNTALSALELGDNPLGAGVSALLAQRHLHAAAARKTAAAAAADASAQGVLERRAAAAVQGSAAAEVQRVKPGTVVARRQGMSMREELAVARGGARDAASLLPLQTKDGM